MTQRSVKLQANGFCGRCGAPTVPIEAGAKRKCTKDKSHRLYPRTDPVVSASRLTTSVCTGWLTAFLGLYTRMVH